ncbi:MAG TPA: hypothetical protein VK764_06490 [Terracidiphilus sp.]|jgi:hypothetical protein|nr:hypothetical protein [Terracidiphilus sp.]
MPDRAPALIEPRTTPSSFAGFLARFAAPSPTTDRWNDDALADDIATLSYEQALRTHTRFHPSSQPSPSDLDLPGSRLPTPAAASAQATAAAGPASIPACLAESRKSSSITIRLSSAECEQLRRRAAAAGLTVSAYLRSCIFEVESLRAQVKDTLAQLRSGPAVESASQHSAPRDTAAPQTLGDWHFFPRLHLRTRGARA